MKSEIRFKKTAVLLLAAALIGTVLAAFLPYALEPLLGLAAACIAVHAVFLAHEKFIHPFWVTLLAAAASAVSVVLTLVLILGHRLGLYTLIQALNTRRHRVCSTLAATLPFEQKMSSVFLKGSHLQGPS